LATRSTLSWLYHQLLSVGSLRYVVFHCVVSYCASSVEKITFFTKKNVLTFNPDYTSCWNSCHTSPEKPPSKFYLTINETFKYAYAWKIFAAQRAMVGIRSVQSCPGPVRTSMHCRHRAVLMKKSHSFVPALRLAA